MLSAVDAHNIAKGTYPEELKTQSGLRQKLLSDQRRNQRSLKTAGYNVRIFSFHSGYITYINWAKE